MPSSDTAPSTLKLGVAADDLTGACATGALLARLGRVAVQVSPAAAAWPTDMRVVSTNTRTCAPDEARTHCRDAARDLLACRPGLVAVRIDSTLRGHIGIAVRAFLDARPFRAAVVAAVPMLGRTTVEGRHYVDGRLVATTEAGDDAIPPPESSSVLALMEHQTGLRVEHVALPVVRRGPGAVRDAFLMRAARIVTFDAETDADIAAIAAGLADLPVLPVDPGPFTAALTARRFPGPGRPTRCPHADRVLVLAGSPTALTALQVETLERTRTCVCAVLSAEEAQRPAHLTEVTRVLCDHLGAHRVAGVKVVGRTLARRDRAVATALAEITQAVLDRCDAGVIICGGDVAAAVCDRLAVGSLEIAHEVSPFCAAGYLVTGPHARRPVVTKGGLVGTSDTLMRCVDALLGDNRSPAAKR
ncbi:MAG TPA: four-carbon acid sugar kinase family protein [bacterium]|nr:four-carbon acid sugar kinase family protein [bacterium]